MIIYYQYYLEAKYPDIDFNPSPEWIRQVESRNWEEPQTSLELSDAAVIALIEAETAEDNKTRKAHLTQAFNLLNRQVEDSHPLQIAHLALLYLLIDNKEIAMRLAFSQFINLLQSLSENSVIPPGLIYLPFSTKFEKGETIKKIIETDNGIQQALLMSLEIALRCPLVFYNAQGQKKIQMSLAINPASLENNFKLGLAYLHNKQVEGLYYLHNANSIQTGLSEIIQALYLAYRDLKQISIAQYWHQIGQSFAQKSSQWAWTEVPLENESTYVIFQEYLLAVQPSLYSIVTSVMLAEGDWFETEMELWRTELREGMTVIDVGANAGVYTFSAASQVGETGKVIAIEPFSQCVKYLEQTVRLNNLSCVKIYHSAASKEAGTGFLSLNMASELNEIIKGEVSETKEGEKIIFITLDSLIEKEELQQVDWLKIDVEGYEIEVLLGSQKLIERFSPKIIYESFSDKIQEVAEFLQVRDYQLFRYQSYLQELQPIESLDDLKQCVKTHNVIAIRKVEERC